MTVALTTIARGADSGITAPRRMVVRDRDAWRALWAAHAGPAAAAPAVDFAAHMVAAVFAGERPDAGHAVAITSAQLDEGTLTLVVEEPGSSTDRVAAQILVSPFHIVTLARFDGEVRFAGAGAQPPAAPPAPSRAPRATAAAPSSTGLDPHMAASLAYLAGPFSGGLMLLVERTNRDVRFHAWQAVIGLGGLGVLAVVVLVCAFLTLLISPLLFTVMYRLSAAAAGLWVVAWGWCLVMAFTGRRAKLPVAGRFAERLATGQARRP